MKIVTATLEQELEQLITDADYRVMVAHVGDNHLRLRIIYLPHLNVRGEGAFAYVAHGLVGENYWIGRNPKRRWRKAAKWAQLEIAGHRELMRTVNVA